MYVVCLLFYAIGGVLVFIFNRPYMVDTLFIYMGCRFGKRRVLFCIVQLVFDFFNTRHGSLNLSRIEFLQLIFGNTERLVSSL